MWESASQYPYVVGAAAAAAAGKHGLEWPGVAAPGWAARLVHCKAQAQTTGHLTEPLVARLAEEPEEVVVRWAAAFGFVVAAGSNLVLGRMDVWVMPPPAVGSAEGVDSQGRGPVLCTQAVTAVPGPQSALVRVIDSVSEHGPHRTES